MPDEQETPKPEAPKTETKERRLAPAVEKPAAASGRQVVAAGAGAPAVVVMQPPVPTLPAISRRKVLLIGFWAGMGAMLLGIVSTILTILYPRGIKGFGGKIFVGTVDQLEPGKKIHNLEAKTWLVRFDAQQAKRNPGAQEGAVLALYHKCVHLGCTVPYKPDFSREDPRNNETYAGWFLCPCHGSTYSDAGVRVFGPAPRSLDTFPLTIDGGKMTVNTGKVVTGSSENPSRAVMPG